MKRRDEQLLERIEATSKQLAEVTGALEEARE